MGNGYKNRIFKDNQELSDVVRCDIVFNINTPQGVADVETADGNSEIGKVDYVFLEGIPHKLLSSDGMVGNTHFYNYDVELRGIQEIRIAIIGGQHTRFLVEGIFLPNIIPIEDEEPVKES
jgi:hypothetical protein